MRQNQYQVNDRTHTTNTPRQDTHGQHWMSARAMSAHFFTSLHPCLTQSGTYDGVESRGWSDTHSHCSAQFTTLITPNISIERPDAHLADGPTQDVAMANHRPYVRGFTHVFHYVRCFIYTRTTGTIVLERNGTFVFTQWFSRHNDKEIINKTFVGQWPCEISFKSFVGSLVCV